MSKKVVNEKIIYGFLLNTKEERKNIMEYVIILILLIMLIGIGYFIFNIQIKEIKNAGKNKKIDEITSKFPKNKEICKAILEKLDNSKVKIKENEDKDNKTSLYIAISDTIFIANIKDTYTRIQTIAHECLHSVQSRRLLLFNFIYSNIYILYFILSIILTILGVFKDYKLQIAILIILGFLYYVVRSYLETEAMTKAPYLAKEYMLEYININPICTKEEIEEVTNEYDRINKLGIPATNYILMANCIIKVVLYILVVLINNLF